jgi:hypothetical protein
MKFWTMTATDFDPISRGQRVTRETEYADSEEASKDASWVRYCGSNATVTPGSRDECPVCESTSHPVHHYSGSDLT